MKSKISSKRKDEGSSVMIKDSVLDYLKKQYDSLSPKQKKLADYIAMNYVKSAFMNAAVLAYNAGVSESTVTRLISVLGYSGYSSFQTACQDLVQSHISSLEKYPLKQTDSDSDIYRQVMSMEAQMFSNTVEMISSETLDSVVDMIYEADELVLVGTVANICLVEYAAYFFSIIGPKVHKITNMDVESLMTIRKLPANSMAMVFSFPRYPRQTQEILELLSKKNVPVAGFTDSITSPIMPFTKYPILVSQKYITFMDPLGPAMALIHALFTGVYLKNKEASHQKVEDFDQYCRSKNFLLRKDVNIVDLV